VGQAFQHTRSFTVDDAGEPVIAVLSYTDRPGTVTANGTAPQVNVLNLSLSFGNCTGMAGNHVGSTGDSTLYGNCFGPMPSDNVNNVQIIPFWPSQIQNGMAFSLEVFARAINGDAIPGPVNGQDFAIWVYNAY
jgi:hypothetical protein